MDLKTWSVTSQQIVHLLIIGCAPQLFFGNIFVFPTYMNTLKVTLLLNQHQVELLGGAIALSFSLGVPAAVFLQKFGTKATLVVAMLVTCSGYLSCWSVKFMNPRSAYIFPILLISFLAADCVNEEISESRGIDASHGGSYTYIATLVTTCRNFGQEHQGKVISLLEAAYSVSPIINQQIYLIFFVEGKYENYNCHNVFGFFLFSFAFALAVNVMCLLCVLLIDMLGMPADTDQMKTAARYITQPENECRDDSEEESLLPFQVETSFSEMLKKLNTHLLFWSTILGIGVTLLFELNVSVLTETLHYNQKFDVLFIAYQTCAVLSRVALGCIADALVGKISCMIHLAVVSIVTGIVFLLASLLDISLVFSFMFMGINGVMLGVVRPVVAISMKRRFSESLFASSWTMFVFCGSCFNLILQQILSTLYQSKVPQGKNTCYGQECLQDIFIMFSSMCFVTASFSSMLTIRAF